MICSRACAPGRRRKRAARFFRADTNDGEEAQTGCNAHMALPRIRACRVFTGIRVWGNPA